MDILNLLSSKTRYELAGDRLTAYGLEPGVGSVNWWDGGWDNDEFKVPIQLENVFTNGDGQLDFFDERGQSFTPRVCDHLWQPDRTKTVFRIPHGGWIEQIRWIDHDVVGVRLFLKHSNSEPMKIRMHWSGQQEAGEGVSWKGRYGWLYRSVGRLARVWRVITFHGSKSEKVSSICSAQGLRLDLSVPAEGMEIYLFLGLGQDRKELSERMENMELDPGKSLRKTEEKWRRFFEHQVPKIEGLPQGLIRQYYHLFYVHQANTYPKLGGMLNHSFTCPSKFGFLPQWCWDTAFHSVVEKWLYNFPAAEGSIRNILESQKPDGRLPFTLDKQGFTFDRLLGMPLVQPFILPLAVWDLYLANGKKSWIVETLPRLVAFDRWLERNRTCQDGLVYICASGEGGSDNSVRWPIDHTQPGCTDTPAAKGVVPSDYNAFILQSRQLIARMADITGQTKLADEYRSKVQTTAKGLQTLWREDIGIFVDRHSNGQPGTTITAGGLIPLLSGVATRKQAGRIVSLLKDPRHFWCRYPIPMLSMSDPRWSDEDNYSSYTNARSWCHLNWLLTEGLLRYGFRKEARELIERTLEMLSAAGEPSCVENFHPHRPQSLATHNVINFGWSALPNDLLLRRILGIQARLDRNTIVIDPLGLTGLKEVLVSGLHVGSHILNFQYRRKGRNIEVVILRKTDKPLNVTAMHKQIPITRKGVRLLINPKISQSPSWLEGNV
jgi:hypothetical protein